MRGDRQYPYGKLYGTWCNVCYIIQYNCKMSEVKCSSFLFCQIVLRTFQTENLRISGQNRKNISIVECPVHILILNPLFLCNWDCQMQILLLHDVTGMWHEIFVWQNLVFNDIRAMVVLQ